MERGKPSVLLISPGRGTDEVFSLLPDQDFELAVTHEFNSVAQLLETRSFDALLLDLSASTESSLPELSYVTQWAASTALIAYGPPLAALERDLLTAGASEYVPRPASREMLKLALGSAFARTDTNSCDSPCIDDGSGLLGRSSHMKTVRDTVTRVASGTATVLVRGETGTGKELIARAIHSESARSGSPFIKVQISALPEALLESELFGYEKGAFTGATTRKAGRVELAEGGTLFLDEIGELSPLMQTKLLRLIQDREYERLGGTRTLRANVRFIAATHRDLKHMVDCGAFREDLYFRLNVVTVWLPPLRARREDIGLIANHYFEYFRQRNGKPDLRLADSALGVLQSQRWPGNVRELVNFMERTVVLANGNVIGADAIEDGLQAQDAFLTQATADSAQDGRAIASIPEQRAPSLESARGSEISLSEVRPLHEDVRRAEVRALTKALAHAKGNKTLAARLLGVSRRTLYTKLEEHGIS